MEKNKIKAKQVDIKDNKEEVEEEEERRIRIKNQKKKTSKKIIKNNQIMNTHTNIQTSTSLCHMIHTQHLPRIHYSTYPLTPYKLTPPTCIPYPPPLPSSSTNINSNPKRPLHHVPLARTPESWTP